MERGWLKEQLERGKSLEAIGELAGKDASTVGYWVKKHGLVAVNREKHASRGGIDRYRLEQLIERGLSMNAMSRALGVSLSTVRHWMGKYGLKSTAYGAPAGDKPKYIERVCRKHGRTSYVRSGAHGYYRCRKCRSERVSARRRRVKRILVAEAGGRCVSCGYDRSPAALHFHHLDPLSKSFSLSRKGVTRSIAELREEARKCILLCSNCHAEVEAGVISATLIEPRGA